MKSSTVLDRKPFHLLIFPLVFVVNHFYFICAPDPLLYENFFAWAGNLIFAWIATTVFFLSIYFLFLRWQPSLKSAVLATLISVFFFFFQDLFFSLEKLVWLGLRTRVVLPLIASGLAVVCIWIWRTDKSLHVMTQLVNVTSIALFAYGLVVATLTDGPLNSKGSLPKEIVRTSCQKCPDIYLIVLDSYTSNKSLSHYFHFDNTRFTNSLLKKGFQVAYSAKSRYARTEYSIAALLNFGMPIDSAGIRYNPTSSIKTNSVVESLKAKGYTVSNFSLFDIEETKAYYAITPAFPVTVVNRIIQSSLANMVLISF